MNDEDQEANTDSFPGSCETPRLRQGLGKSSSASSSGSFDSCSDLLGSLENASESLDDSRNLPQTDDKESDQKNDGNFSQASCRPESLSGNASFKQCEGIMKGEVSSHQDLKDDAVKGGSAVQKEHAYGLSSAISFSKVRFFAENTAERFSQLQTSFRLPTSYIFPSKNALQAENIASQTVAATDVLGMHGEHKVEKESNLGDSADKDILNADARILQAKQPRVAASTLPESVVVHNLESGDMQTKDLFIQNEPRTQEYAIMSAESSAEVKVGDDSIARTKGKMLTRESSGSDTVASAAAEDLNGVAETDASSKVSVIENSESPDLPLLGFTDGLQSAIEQMPEEHPGSRHFEAPLLLSDLHTNGSDFSHPLRTFSSGSGRPDLEEVDEGKEKAGGMGVNKLSMNLVNAMPVSADSFLNAQSHGSINIAHTSMGNDLNIDSHISRSNQPLSYSQNEAFARWSCANEEGELFWHDQPSLVGSQGFRSEEEAFRGTPHQSGWADLRFPQGDKREQNDSFGPDELCKYVENLQLNENYVDTVLDMEDVLLNRDKASHESFLLATSSPLIGTPRSSRDGSLSSSTSGLHSFTSGESTPFTVDWVEVVGAKQRRGGSSFGERIVGVKDHTVYCIKVLSRNQEWEVSRRYRDFVDLYYQLRRKFDFRKELCLPSPWKDVERDSRKIFGSTHSNIIEIRSSRIEKCLQSLLQAGPPLSTSAPLCWFLCPQSGTKGPSFLENQRLPFAAALPRGQDVQLGSLESPHLQSPRSEVGSYKGELDNGNALASFGKTVKLDLKTHPNKNIKLLLSAQHYSCAGCYKQLETERGLVHGFVQTLGWGKPRLCEYSGQLFCTSCHLNEFAVLPAQVLWHWDFTPRRVSQLAKAYLDSIYDQPMLCVSAVNPYLYSRVPILSHIKDTRRKLNKMLACIVCPFHARIFQTMGSRRYLMENNDFFALRDLEDLSKGAFAVLPSLLKAVLENLRGHITKQCSVCSETGEWCGAGVLCEEPFSPIFPFEEENITSCKVCHTAFHKACFSDSFSCPACSDDQNNKIGASKMLDHPEMEGVAENHRDFKLLLQGDRSLASSSLADTDVQGGFELDKQAHTNKNWPFFYNLLPKKRLWHALGV